VHFVARDKHSSFFPYEKNSLIVNLLQVNFSSHFSSSSLFLFCLKKSSTRNLPFRPQNCTGCVRRVTCAAVPRVSRAPVNTHVIDQGA
jgi:hypothetical protein